LNTWQVWLAGRQADGYTQAITTMPTESANWNNTIVVDGTTVTDISAFPQPQQWTRLTVQGALQKYATYTWDSVTSTCALSGQTETDLQQQVLQAFPPLTGDDRDAEIDSMMQIVQTLTDTQKVQAEFWAGSAKGSVSPPLMAVWLWKEYARSVVPTCPTLIFSLLDLAVNLFENSRFVWGLKGQIMQDRPIQEVRRRYTGRTLQSWNGTVDGSQWVPYQRANFVTPPFPDYSSGHSAFTSAFSLVMTKWFNATITKNPITYDNLPIMCPLFTATQTTNYGDFVVSPGASLIQPGVAPSQAVVLSFNQWSDIATSAGMSRLYGGIHTLAAHQASQFAATNCVKPQVDSTWNITISVV
jgi:hypothetical protein